MKVIFLVFGATALIVILSQCGPIECQEGEEVEVVVEKSCQKWIFDLLSIVFGAVGPCVSQMFINTPPGGGILTGVFCLVKCLINELGLLDEEGKLDQVAAAIFFGENFPGVLRDEIVSNADPCFKMAEEFNGKEQFCRSYAAFAQCAGTVVIQAIIPYAISCFGNPFITAGLNLAFGFLISQTPRGHLAETPNIIALFNNTSHYR